MHTPQLSARAVAASVVARSRYRSTHAVTIDGRLAYTYALLPVHFVMERTMLLGIKRRAERATSATGRDLPVTA